MFHVLLFTCLGLAFALFAIAAGRAGEPVVLVTAGVLAVWMIDLATGAMRRVHRRRTTSSRSSSGRP